MPIDDRIDGPIQAGRGTEFIQIAHNFFLVGDGDINPDKIEGAHTGGGFSERGGRDVEGDINIRQAQRSEGRIVHGRRAGVGNGIAENPNDPGFPMHAQASHAR